MDRNSYDFVIIGSGFGGSVTAMRLTALGYRVLILEQGKRWKESEFPRTNWNLKRFLWAPAIRFFGPQSIVFLKGLMVLRGVGVGGGSLVYANTLMRPKGDVLDSPDWPIGVNWKAELEPHYQSAEQMLGVTKVPKMFAADEYLKALSIVQGRQETFHPTNVAVFFNDESDKSVDPYFNGDGPLRKPCVYCGACMIGCPNGSKNTLDKNYLYFAEKWGAQVLEMTKAEKIVPKKSGYSIEYKNLSTGRPGTVSGTKIVLAAGGIGTTELLLKNKFQYKTLLNISETLGRGVRTNGESLVGMTQTSGEDDFSKGVAIGSAYHPDESTKIEAVRYPRGSGAMRLLAVPLAKSGGKWGRPIRFFLTLPLRIVELYKIFTVKDWARSSVILLVMKTTAHTMRFSWKRNFLFGRLRGEPEGEPIPSYLQVAQDSVTTLAGIAGGIPQNALSEVAFGATATAHILGGCQMGDSIRSGVVDSNHQVFEYPGLFVCDGSVIPTNLGVNPSLTITALAERFSSQFKKKAD